MEYIKVRWIHDHEDEPILLYSELDHDRFELRKVYVYEDGSVGWASSEVEFGGTALSYEPLPDNAEIAQDPEFLLEVISQDEFEAVWNDYVWCL